MSTLDEQTKTGIPTEPNAADDERAQTRKRLQDRRDFTSHVVAYIVVNAFLVAVWAITDYGGYFWPVWVIAGWGVGLLLHAYETFFHRPVSEADVDAELRRRP